MKRDRRKSVDWIGGIENMLEDLLHDRYREKPKDDPVDEIKFKISKKTLTEAIKIIDRFYNLDGDINLIKTIRSCAISWIKVLRIQEEGLKAKIVLDAYYQADKIYDNLCKFSAFAEKVDTASSLEVARLKGYCNYLFFVENQMNGLSEKYKEPARLVSVSEDDINEEVLMRFWENECAELFPAKKMKATRSRAEELLNKITYNEKDYRYYQTIIKNVESINRWENEDIEFIRKLQESLDNQYAVISENIEKANELYSVMKELLNQSWFDSMNNEFEDCPVANMDQAEIKVYYEKQFSEIKEKLLEKYKR